MGVSRRSSRRPASKTLSLRSYEDSVRSTGSEAKKTRRLRVLHVHTRLLVRYVMISTHGCMHAYRCTYIGVI